MKKIILFSIIFIIGLGTGKAVPLTITNTSIDNPPIGMYDVYTFLSFVEAGDSCEDYWALPFIFEVNSILQINDGSFPYSFGNNSECISYYLQYNNCEPIELDWTGQRFYEFKALMEPYNNIVPQEEYPEGILGLSTGGPGCLPSDVSGNVVNLVNGPNFYFLNMEFESDLFLQIIYNRYGNALATLSYE